MSAGDVEQRDGARRRAGAPSEPTPRSGIGGGAAPSARRAASAAPGYDVTLHDAVSAIQADIAAIGHELSEIVEAAPKSGSSQPYRSMLNRVDRAVRRLDELEWGPETDALAVRRVLGLRQGPASLLLHLVNARGRTVQRDDLCRELGSSSRKVVDVYMVSVRNALRGTACEGAIKTVHGHGYSIALAEADTLVKLWRDGR